VKLPTNRKFESKKKNSKPIQMVQVVVYFNKIIGFSEMVDFSQF
jgi:hypothetical protein